MPQTNFDQDPHLLEGRKARLTINTAWLIKLRWVAAIGQLITVATVMFVFQVEVHWEPLAIIILLTSSSNLLLTYRFESLRSRELNSLAPWESLLFGVMLLDLGFLTAMLSFSGGISNPFSVFYLVNLALAATVLTPRNTGILAIVTVGCIALLLIARNPTSLLGGWHIQDLENSIPLHILLDGTSIALVTCAMVIVYFTTRLNVELQRKEASLRVNEIKQARSEKLEALGTLAAGAAHELSTPLATIAVVAKEVQRGLEKGDFPAEIKEDIGLIRSELDRCRAILDQMSTDAGQATGEPIIRVTAQNLLEDVVQRIETQHRDRVTMNLPAAQAEIEAPRHLLAQAIRGLIKNAIDATPANESIELEATVGDQEIAIIIRDHGTGMPPDILARIGEPFFTTKQPGSGTGLGVFLAKNVVEKLNGEVRIESEPQLGTTVTLLIPRSTAENKAKTAKNSIRDT